MHNRTVLMPSLSWTHVELIFGLPQQRNLFPQRYPKTKICFLLLLQNQQTSNGQCTCFTESDSC